MEKFFRLKENGTKVSTEIIAGLTTFFTMAYIIVVNPSILSQAGMEWGAVFLATIISAIIGTLVMGLVANVPYAQAPGMGLNAFFVYTVCFQLGFSWQQALSMVFICGLVNILITVTKVRKHIIKAIPRSLQNAIGGGIGIFIAYIGLLNVGFINFSAGVPAMSLLNAPVLWVFLIGLAITLVLLFLKVKGAILIGIIATTLVGLIPGWNVTQVHDTITFSEALGQLPTTFGAIFTGAGLGSLFNDVTKLPIVLITIFSFSLSDTFDTIGTFIGTGRRSGIFSEEDEKAMEDSQGFSSKMDKALFSDAIATSIGAIVRHLQYHHLRESASGIAPGARASPAGSGALLRRQRFLASFISAVPSAATAPALVAVGCMMIASFKEIDWEDFLEAVPAFFAGVFMALSYSISYGIAAGFITYVLTKVFSKKIKEIHPIVWIASLLFVLNFALLAILPPSAPAPAETPTEVVEVQPEAETPAP